jgi:hypothetical protein
VVEPVFVVLCWALRPLLGCCQHEQLEQAPHTRWRSRQRMPPGIRHSGSVRLQFRFVQEERVRSADLAKSEPFVTPLGLAPSRVRAPVLLARRPPDLELRSRVVTRLHHFVVSRASRRAIGCAWA